jgi:hypothetical protein
MSLILAPAFRISSIRSWCLGRSRTISHVADRGRMRPRRAHVVADRREQADPARARGLAAIVRMYMSGRYGASWAGGDDHRDRTAAAAGNDTATLERV